MSLEYFYQQELFETNIVQNPDLISNPDNLEALHEYCQQERLIAPSLRSNINWFKDIGIICSFSYISSIVAQLLTTFSKQNVQLDPGKIAFEGFNIISGFYLMNMVGDTTVDLLSSNCIKAGVKLTPQEIEDIDFVFTIQWRTDYLVRF